MDDFEGVCDGVMLVCVFVLSDVVCDDVCDGVMLVCVLVLSDV